MDAEVGRRIRAARAYADIKQPHLAAQLGVSRDTVYRLEKGGRQLRPLENEEALLERIADLCGLPAAFFTIDLAELDMLATPEDRELLAREASRAAADEEEEGLDPLARIQRSLNRIEANQHHFRELLDAQGTDHDLIEQINVAVEELRGQLDPPAQMERGTRRNAAAR
jgi:transcriptional regulator with XRE-family HTH domain